MQKCCESRHTGLGNWYDVWAAVPTSPIWCRSLIASHSTKRSITIFCPLGLINLNQWPTTYHSYLHQLCQHCDLGLWEGDGDAGKGSQACGYPHHVSSQPSLLYPSPSSSRIVWYTTHTSPALYPSSVIDTYISVKPYTDRKYHICMPSPPRVSKEKGD